MGVFSGALDHDRTTVTVDVEDLKRAIDIVHDEYDGTSYLGQPDWQWLPRLEAAVKAAS